MVNNLLHGGKYNDYSNINDHDGDYNSNCTNLVFKTYEEIFTSE